MCIKYKVASIGPSLVDITFNLNSEKYDNILQLLDAKSGDWIPVTEYGLQKDMFKKITNIQFPETFQELISLRNNGIINITAGSTNLGVFSAFNKSIRKQSAIITAVGTVQGERDPISEIYSKCLAQLEIDHIQYPIEGRNPLGIIITSISNPEKVLITYSGISNELSEFPDIEAEVLFVEAYELRNGKLSILIDRIINSGKFKIALGLGNEKLLDTSMIQKITQYIVNGNIHILSGNETEFAKLADISNTKVIKSNTILKHIPYLLITKGAQGLVGIFENEVITKKAIKPEVILSTSGAGDVSAGVFISGIICNKNPNEILDDAVFYASKILGYYENILPEGRE